MSAPSQIVALAACLLYCAASSATLASAGAGPTDLGALRAPCDGTLGQCAVGATRAGGGRQRRVPAAGAGAAAADQPVHQAPPQARGAGEVRWLPSSTNCSPLPATGGGGASSIRVHDAPRRWHRTLDSPRMARPGGGGCSAPSTRAHGTPWWWRLRRTSVRGHDTPGDGAARPVEMAAPGGAAGRRVRWRAPGTPRDVACSSAHPAATDGVQPSGGGGSSSAAGLGGVYPTARPVLLFRRRCFVDKPVRTFTGDSLMSGSSSSTLMTDVGGGGQRFYLL